MKVKEFSVETWTGPEIFRSLRLPNFKPIGKLKWYICQHYVAANLTPQEIFLVFNSEGG
jgi:hypothetical protein